MKSQFLDANQLKKFDDEKRYKALLWEKDNSTLNLICLKPGQEIKPHVHDGDHIWVVMEGAGEYLSDEEGRQLTTGMIVIAPTGEPHGIRNNTEENLVFASITV